MLEKLCHPKASLRYTVEQALQHPWITRNFETEIPRNNFEQNMFFVDLEEKLRRAVNTMFALSVIKNCKSNKKAVIDRRTVLHKFGKQQSFSPHLIQHKLLFGEGPKVSDPANFKFKSQS